MTFFPTDMDIQNARMRELNIHPDVRHRVAWFWRPLRGRYELRVLNNGQWTVLSR